MNNCIVNNSSQPKVSVIIPIYNTESYLQQALDSICNQSLPELEIILINDGSTDNSQNIIEEYTRKDARISYRVQPNQGQGVARNNGLQLAKGKYIYFMDSDDVLVENALKHCYEKCEQNKLDFVFFDAETISEDPEKVPTFNYCRKEVISEDKIWNGIELLKHELEHNFFIVAPWLYFTNHDFLKKNFGGFPSGIIHEDHIFAMQIALNAQRVYYISHPYFKRRVRALSTMTRQLSMRNIEGYTTVCTQINEWSRQHQEWSPIIKLYLVETLSSVIWLGHQMTLLEKIETACRFRRLHLSKYVAFKKWFVFWLK